MLSAALCDDVTGFDEAGALEDALEDDALPQAANRHMSIANVKKTLSFFIWYLRRTITVTLVILQSWN